MTWHGNITYAATNGRWETEVSHENGLGAVAFSTVFTMITFRISRFTDICTLHQMKPMNHDKPEA